MAIERIRSRLRTAPSRFSLILGVETAVGLLVRTLYVLFVTRHTDTQLYDSFWYETQAINLAHGRFFPALNGHGPGADHPPLTSLLLAPSTYLFGVHQGETAERLTMAVLGAAVVVAVGLLGRAVAGAGVGMISGAIAAVYPEMVMPSGILMSETVTMLLTALLLLAAYRMLRAPTWRVAAVTGLVAGLDILARAEIVLLVALLFLGLTLAGRRRSLASRVRSVAVMTGVLLLVVGPWVGRNLASFRDTTVLTTSEGPLLAGANCRATYFGGGIGFWSLDCAYRGPQTQDQSVSGARELNAAKRYAERNAGRWPAVVAARVGRVWGVYAPRQMASLEIGEGRPYIASLAGLASYYLLMPFAIGGIVVLRRRRLPQWPLLLCAIAVTAVAGLTYGLERFRAEFEVCFVVLAAVGLHGLAAGLRRTVAGSTLEP